MHREGFIEVAEPEEKGKATEHQDKPVLGFLTKQCQLPGWGCRWTQQFVRLEEEFVNLEDPIPIVLTGEFLSSLMLEINLIWGNDSKVLNFLLLEICGQQNQ